MRRQWAAGLAAGALTACSFPTGDWQAPGEPDGDPNAPGNGWDGDGNPLLDDTASAIDTDSDEPTCRGSAIAVSPDEAFVVVRGEGEVVVVDVATEAVVLRLPEADERVSTVYFDRSGHAFLRWTGGRLDVVDLLVGERSGGVDLAWSRLAASPSGAFLAPSDTPEVLRTDDLGVLEVPLTDGDVWLTGAWQDEARVGLVERDDTVPSLWLVRWRPGEPAAERVPLGPIGEYSADIVEEGLVDNEPWLDVAPDGRIAFRRVGLDGLAAFGVVDPGGDVLFGPAVDSPVAFVADGRWLVGWQFVFDEHDRDGDEVLFESGLEVFDPADAVRSWFVPTDDVIVWPSWAVVGGRWLVVDPDEGAVTVFDLDAGEAVTDASLEGAIRGDFVEAAGALVFVQERQIWRWTPGVSPASPFGIEARHVAALPGHRRLVVDSCTVGKFRWLADDTLEVVGGFWVAP